MRILFWTDGFLPRLGGIETQGLQFIKGMQKRGHSYIVIAQKDHPSWNEDEICHGITIKRFDFNAIIAKKELSIIASLQAYIEWIMKEFQPDIVHLNASVGGSSFAFSLFVKMFCLPVVFTAHAPYLHENKVPPVLEKIVSSVDQTCCVSNWVLKEMQKNYPAHKAKLRLIYNGLPMPEIIPAPLCFSPPVLLLFGRLSTEKGFDTAVQAFSLLKKSGSNAQLIIAGGGPERQTLEKLVGELALSDSVRFTGVLTPEEVLDTFNQATLVIVPSIIESFGLVILESMQMQRPVIATNVEGVPEVITNYETGLLVPVRNPLALCQAIQSLLDQPDRAIRMGIQGYKRAIEKFTLDRNVLEYEELYTELLLTAHRSKSFL